MLHVHVPKAAGTTINSILENSFGASFLVVEPWRDINRRYSLEDLQLLNRRMPWVKHLSSHWFYDTSSFDKVFLNIQAFAFFRDPLRRYVSAYVQHNSKTHSRITFQKYMANSGWFNMQTRTLAGGEDLRQAKQAVGRLSFVGIVEQLDESLVLMKKVLSGVPLDIRYGTPKNVGRPPPGQSTEQLLEAHYEAVLERNLLDVQLYSFVADVLYPAQKAAFGPDLDRRVAEFRSANSVFQYSRPFSYSVSRAYYKVLLAAHRAFFTR